MPKGFLEGYKTYDTKRGFGSADSWRQAFNHRMNTDEAKQLLHESKQTPYEVLGVLPSATKAEIKKAYYTLIKAWHPDNNQHRLADSEEMSKKIIAAYSLLTA